MSNLEDDFKLDALLSQQQQTRLLELLGTLGGASVELADNAEEASNQLEFNLDTLGWLRTELPAIQSEAAARLFELILFYAGKYRLAANLHHDVTEASYIELQQKHAALLASEARYKTLSEQLQQQVEKQVKVIEQTQHQLYESARLRAVGQLAAGVAHEINTPIGFIGSNLRVADDYLDEIEASLSDNVDPALLLDDFRALLGESKSGVKRIASIVADLRTFANIDQADFATCDLNALLMTTCHLLQAEHNHTLPIELRLGELPKLAGYPAKLSQAFYNILDNAAKALNEGGRIQVESRLHDGALEVYIEDNGCGMSEDILLRVFEPFFTTRSVGAGSGLGLSVTRDILVAHQGEVRLYSRLGQGTRVTLRFQTG
ncbi:sensor histidine kinase [Phytohalomonas tamaricis]|uniref:sensor histidine kinase n=1 Tax=Phytohalomonas tamaricis TaxID=2081032 RepID=UPI000D0AFFD0|nr:HAMP domain-containing sensor histidine kinase [Phytohalomonas tamaricis]